ncbi:MAG: hypothetical protein ABI330_19180 [Caldimonas sp.]
MHESSPAIRDACARSITGHAATLEADIAEALAASSRGAGVDACGLALHTQAVLQGAFILAKATQDVAAAATSIGHLRAYLEFLFDRPGRERRTSPAPPKGEIMSDTPQTSDMPEAPALAPHATMQG